MVTIRRFIACFIFLLFSSLYINLLKAEAAEAVVQIEVLKANIRSEPANTADIIAKAERNDRFKVLQEKFGWYEIQLPNGGSGWIAGYIVGVESHHSENGKQATITSDHVHVRSHPSISANIIGKLHKGDQVTYTKEQNGWMNITYNNQSAWISKQFLRFPETSKQDTQSGGFAYISTDKTNLRSGADTSAPIITKGSTGERYPIIGQEGDWYKITLASGRDAYVAGWVVSLDGNSQSQAAPTMNETNRTSGLSGKTIVLDAGHGGHDPGTANHTGVSEKQLTMQTAQRLQQKLSDAGAKVILTRSDDRYVTLDARVSSANRHNADAFISLHYDSSVNPEANGVTAYYYHGYQYDLASNVNQVLESALSLNNRGIRSGNYHVIRENTRPATLLELGYLSHPDEGQYVTSDSYQELVTNSIYNGLQSYFK